MEARACAGLLLLSLSGVVSDADIRLFNLPVNITSWQISFREAVNHTLTHPLEGIRKRLHGFLDYAKNATVDCVAEGEECIPEFSSCCPGDYNDDGIELRCLPEGDFFACSLPRSSEEVSRRLVALRDGDSVGRLDSHPWANSWAFQSRSEAEREEAEIAEEEEWKKNFVPDNTDNLWVKMYKNVKNNAIEMWSDMRKLKKLKEIKAILIEKYKKRLDKNKDQPRDMKMNEEEAETQRPLFYPEEIPKDQEESGALYPDEPSEQKTAETAQGQGKEESEESIIKFSDETQKPEKKINFRIDDIIKDAVDIIDEKLKKKEKPNKHKGKHPTKQTSSSEERPFHLDDIKDTENNLIKEINELKKLKQKQKENRIEHKLNALDIEEMIKRQVSAILEEERKLDKLKKIEELRRIEEEMKKQGPVNT